MYAAKSTAHFCVISTVVLKEQSGCLFWEMTLIWEGNKLG